MYVDYFQLQREPFRAAPKGTDVFVGPQTAKIMKSLRNALAHPDAVVAVTGDAGIGKSTLVNRALEETAGNMTVIRMPRAKLAHDEVLDFLLQQLQATEIPASAIRKVLLCRTLLAAHAENGKPVSIVVEDALRIGTDALVELEALTAADSDSNRGSRMVLIGDNELAQSLQANGELARLNLRLRLRFPVQALDSQELLAYLKHNFRLAGAEFERIFSGDCNAALASLSGGNPRLANKLVEAALTAAAEQQIDEIDPAFVADTARLEFDLHYAVPTSSDPASNMNRDPRTTRECDAPPEETTSSTETGKRFAVPGSMSAANSDSGADPDEKENDADENENEETSNTITAEKLVLPEQQASLTAAAEQAASHSADKAPSLRAKAVEPAINDALPDLDDIAAEFTSAAAKPAAVTHPTIDETLDAEPEPATESTLDTSTELPMLYSSAKIHAPQASAAPADSPPAAVQEQEQEQEQPVTGTTATPDVAANADVATPLAAARTEAEQMPAWERDPTLAELRPDLEALEAAMAEFDCADAPAKDQADEPDPEIELKDPTFAGVPEITLDIAIQQKIAEATEALEQHDATIAEEEIDDAPIASSPEETSAVVDPVAQAVPAQAEPANATPADSPVMTKPEPEPVDAVALGIANARSLEDVDDKMAETLFGEEFTNIAAQISANPLTEELAAANNLPQELSLVADESTTPTDAPVDADAKQSQLEQEFRDVYGENAVEVSLQSDRPRGGMDLSASQRLATVRALNANKGVASPQARVAVNGGSAGNVTAPAAPPQPIEDQINTSMSQTLQALSSRRRPANDGDDDDSENGRTGFFSRFKR